MDTGTVLDIIKRIESASNFAKEEYQEGFECETNREYKAYVKGQCNALDGVINHLQNYIEAQVNYAENTLGE
jgi:hypothetical protein